MTTTHARGAGTTAVAFSAVILMLSIARNAGFQGVAPTGLLVVAGVVVLTCLMLMALLSITRRPSPNEQIVRAMMETMGMLTVATPIVLVGAMALGVL